MKLHAGTTQAYKRRWSLINNFEVILTWTGPQGQTPADVVGLPNSEHLSLNLIDFTTPQLGADMIEIYQTDMFSMTPGKLSRMSFSLKFRDQDQMMLYRMFAKIFFVQRNMYHEDACFTAQIVKCPDYAHEYDKVIMELRGCLIENVSQLSFSNATEAQIAEFEISCSCTSLLPR